MNGLKEINDTRGHKAGDQFLRDACIHICEQFKHSPIFRIGGDEFVVILQGPDYRNKERLSEQFINTNRRRLGDGNIVIAFGLAEWKAQEGEPFGKVFERADAQMYQNKRELKEHGA